MSDVTVVLVMEQVVNASWRSNKKGEVKEKSTKNKNKVGCQNFGPVRDSAIYPITGIHLQVILPFALHIGNRNTYLGTATARYPATRPYSPYMIL